MLDDITSEKDNNYCIENKQKIGGKKRGGGVSDSWLDVRKRGGGSFRCVLCATGGVGGSKNREKMRT